MKAITAEAEASLVQRFWVPIVAVLAGSLGATWLATAWFAGATPTRVTVAVVVFAIWCATLTVAATIYLCHRDHLRLRNCGPLLHEINHIYRDALFKSLSAKQGGAPRWEMKQLLELERATLAEACGKIGELFTSLTGRQCVVTVKLLAKGEGDKRICFTWVRSRSGIYRPLGSEEGYTVGDGQNTGFDMALRLRSSAPMHFHSPDLIALQKRGLYRNARPGWERLYKSTIVVPIIAGEDQENGADVIGFLCVDSLSRNRLNATYHVEFLAAFADQMYNYVNLMRRGYTLSSC